MNGLLRKILVMGIVVLLLGAIGPAFFKVNINVEAMGATIYVDDDNTTGPWDGTISHPYQNITSGLEHASYGDTVHVFSGMYTENVVVNKSVTLRGDSKPVIDGMGGIGIDATLYDDSAYGVTIDGFNITNSSHGIQFTMENIENLNNTSIAIGDVILANNTITSTADAINIYVRNVGNYMYGNSTLTIGSFRIADNVVNSDGDGIVIGDFSYIGNEMYGTSSFSMGNIEITNNTATATLEGIHVYSISNLGCYMYEESSFIMGNIVINDNKIDSYNHGVLLEYLEYLGNYMEGNSKFTMGNIEFNHNTIHSAYEGICIREFYVLGYYMYDNSRFVMGSIILNGNVINSNDPGLWFGMGEVGYLGTGMYGNSSFAMGNVEFSGNTINSLTDGMYIDAFHAYGQDMHNSSTFTMGSILVNDNTINSGGEAGIYANGFDYLGADLYDNSSFTMVNIEFCRNTVNGTLNGIHVYGFYGFGGGMNNDSSFKMDDILVNNNVIYSNYYGIFVDYIVYFGGSMYGNASFAVGNIEFNGNQIGSGDDGIYINEISYFGSYMYDSPMFTMGSILVDDNTITSGNYGILVYNMFHFGEEIYGNSSVVMNNIEFCRNTVNSTVDALGFSSFRDFGTYMHDSSSFSMGSVLVNDNDLHSYIWLTSFGSFGSYLYENSSCTIGSVEFGRNAIYSDVADGITFYNLQPFGYEMYNNSLFRMGDFSVNSNVIASDGSRSGISCTEGSEGSGGFGTNIYDDAVAMTGSFRFDSNDISSAWCGLSLWMVKNSTVRNNTLWNCTYGIYLTESADNLFHHNKFVNNTIQAYVTPNYNNTWDNGYPSGGNYWSDYSGTDQYRGPEQNIPGSDYIGDTHYEIDQNNTDHYPFMVPSETQPPTITLQSPENKTYTVNASIPLSFTIDEMTIWTGYSLDGQANVTIVGNTTLPTMPDGWHYATVYANDTFSNMGFATTYFTVDTIKPDITEVLQDPPTDVLPDTLVKVNATVTDATSGIKQVLLNCTFTNSTDTWYAEFDMAHLVGDAWSGTIQALPKGTHVTYVIVAEDNAGNTITTEQVYGHKYEYMIGETQPPTITLQSPENKTYTVNASIPLTFTVDEVTTWIGYSLDEQANVTITGNTTLPTMPDGSHYVTVYANDTFDNMGFATVHFTVDTTKPDITNVAQDPTTDILPDTVVKINATVTDATSGIKQVLLNCTFTNSTDTWHTVFSMAHLTGNIWNATVPPYPYGTNVTYVIVAEDNAGNAITTEQLGYEYGYQVVPEFPLPSILLAFMMAMLLMAIAVMKKRNFT